MKALDRATAFAPATTANLAVGFDILGHALSGRGDRVTALRRPQVGVTISVSGGADLPFDPSRNTAAVGVSAMLKELESWNYWRQAFERDAGLRIDHLLLSPKLAKRLLAAGVDRFARAMDKTSDHAPTWIELKGS